MLVREENRGRRHRHECDMQLLCSLNIPVTGLQRHRKRANGKEKGETNPTNSRALEMAAGRRDT